MHYTSNEYGKQFFKIYINSRDNLNIVDIGAMGRIC